MKIHELSEPERQALARQLRCKSTTLNDIINNEIIRCERRVHGSARHWGTDPATGELREWFW